LAGDIKVQIEAFSDHYN